jgi:hypothetical protein
MTSIDSFSARQFRDLFRSTLLNNVLPFWLQHGFDREHGGIITSLDRDGTILDTDKSIWFQGRTAWMYATAARTYGSREGWLDLARSCLDFIERHAIGPDGKLYFTVTRDGKPLRMRRYVYSEAFAAQGNAAMYRVTQEKAVLRSRAEVPGTVFEIFVHARSDSTQSGCLIHARWLDWAPTCLRCIYAATPWKSLAMSKSPANAVQPGSSGAFSAIKHLFYKPELGCPAGNGG